MKTDPNSMTTGLALVDSNILVYTYDSTDHRRADAIALVKAGVLDQRLVLSIQNLAEYSRVTTEKFHADVTEVRSTLASFSQNFRIISYRPQTVIEALRLKSESGTRFFDALLAATMLENGIQTIYTENAEDFSKIPGIRAVNPFA